MAKTGEHKLLTSLLASVMRSFAFSAPSRIIVVGTHKLRRATVGTENEVSVAMFFQRIEFEFAPEF